VGSHAVADFVRNGSATLATERRKHVGAFVRQHYAAVPYVTKEVDQQREIAGLL
jgi:hypothetical protein